MTEKKKSALSDNDACTAQEAAAAAAHDIAICFKKMNWQVVSFFPNTVCRPSEEQSAKKRGK